MRTSLLILLIASAAAQRGAAGFEMGQVEERGGAVPEYAIKAVFLYNLVKYVDWPPESPLSVAGTPIVIAVIGDDPFGSALDEAVHDRTVRGRTLEIVRTSNPKSLKVVHVAFIGSSESRRAAQLLQVLTARGALTVGDSPDVADAGPAVTFVMVQGRLRFDINDGRAKQCGIEFSSQLLKLARKISEAGS